MASYLISYDLIAPGKDYASLYEAIKNLGNWWHCLDSVWIVKTNNSSKYIRDTLSRHIDSNDKLIVLKLTGEAAWRGFDDECSNWLKNNL